MQSLSTFLVLLSSAKLYAQKVVPSPHDNIARPSCSVVTSDQECIPEEYDELDEFKVGWCCPNPYPNNTSVSRCLPPEVDVKDGNEPDISGLDLDTVYDCRCINVGVQCGDPHITTFDGLNYDCHGRGEFVFVKSLDTPFEIQSRFDYSHDRNGLVNKAVVVKNQHYPKVQVTMDGNPYIADKVTKMHDGCPILFHVDDELRNIFDGSGHDSVTVTVDDSKTNIIIDYHETGISTTVHIRRTNNWGCIFTVNAFMPYRFFDENRIVGLMGTPNGDTSDDWMEPSGATLPPPVTDDERLYEHAYNYCTKNWCIRKEEESLFTYKDTGSFDKFLGCDDEYGILAIQRHGNEDEDKESNMGVKAIESESEMKDEVEK